MAEEHCTPEEREEKKAGFVRKFQSEAQKEKVHKVMSEFKEGALHSGSKEGPKVTNPAQAKAIAMKQSGQSNQ